VVTFTTQGLHTVAHTSQNLTDNARLLKSQTSKSAIYGVLIAFVAIFLATLLVSSHVYHKYSINAFIMAQQENAALWLLDTMPFIFAIWGQYASSMMSYQAGAMIVDQTNELRAQTTALEQKATYDTTHDSLTDLPNRFLFRDRVNQAILNGQQRKHRLAILLMDLNNFKEVNNTLGHYNGDRLLKQIAQRLKNVIHEPNSVARLGGDEFAILLPNLKDHNEVKEMAKKILKSLLAPFQLDDLTLGVQASIGIAIHPEHGNDVDTLQQRADVAMYMAKKNKKGAVLYNPKQDKHSPRRLTLMGELSRAIEQNELLLHYQPKIDIESETIQDVEAIVRWQHPHHGLLGSDEFIPLAERTGLIKPLTIWVMNNGLKECHEWCKRDYDIGLAVNFSAQSLIDLDLPDTIAGMLAAHDVPADHLVIEITESAIAADSDRASKILGRLNDMGVRISIDDFGTGYSSLAYLSKLPVDEIKIDKSFVINMLGNSNDETIVRATIDLGHNLGMKVVAEGVESEEVLKKLQSLGCDIAQGYFLSYPLVINELQEWFKKTHWKSLKQDKLSNAS